ncbi:serine/threonine-protein phosphatase 6 regulatory ankyrin repeat subunit C-like isoform X1 [Branchiostoma floridae]|uniref:Serine/threonine-protein phosphatase 6 regulatory ankyrin repeat subunit C-like isoform X1 n=1 Tax=Branchiostoma floridae TaxID=7739 RepID=A0A9J7MNL3_BRAFL|nr:serine/threonine-protein phosphatase 6 regulatory ankyrin repeat subunit C-like isoform X1 [Branchiostoma floridae]
MAFRDREQERQRQISLGRQLVEASRKGEGSVIRNLLKVGASVDAEEFNRTLFYASQNYLTPLQEAAKFGHADCVRVLIQHAADVNTCDRFDVTAVHLAGEGGHVQCLHALLEAGADPNKGTKYSKPGAYTAYPHPGGTTPLHLAATNDHVDCIRELIINGADYKSQDELGRTSLYISSYRQSEKGVLTHLQNAMGRDILSLPVYQTEETPLHESVRHGMSDAVRALLRHGSDANAMNSSGHSPFHCAVFHTDKFSMAMVKDMLTLGYNTDVNLPTTAGAYPLFFACFTDGFRGQRRPELGELLIAYGAKPELLHKKSGPLITSELKSRDTDMTILQSVADTQPMISRKYLAPDFFAPPIPAQKRAWLEDMTRSPRNLQHLARCVIRSALGQFGLRRVSELPIPSTLKDYLLLLT